MSRDNFYSPNYAGELALKAAIKLERELVKSVVAKHGKDLERRVIEITRIRNMTHEERKAELKREEMRNEP